MDDAVTLVLTYAQVPYDVLYDTEIVLANYLIMIGYLHHEDFTGQYGKFYGAYGHTAVPESSRNAEDDARALGFSKVSLLKLAVAKP